MMQESMTENKSDRDRKQADVAVSARTAREALAAASGIRLQDAVVGQLYRVTALYSGETGIYEYVGCKGSHADVFCGIHVGAIGYFKHPVYGYHTLHGGSSLEPGGRSAQWFMVPLTEEEAAAAPAQFEAARAAATSRPPDRQRMIETYAAYIASLPAHLR